MSKLLLEPIKGNRYRLANNFHYRGVLVREGFETNGADIPRLLWWIWPPNRSDFMKAVVVHDYLCSHGEYQFADQLFKEMLIEADAHRFTVWAFHTGVRIYHRIKYPSHYTGEKR